MTRHRQFRLIMAVLAAALLIAMGRPASASATCDDVVQKSSFRLIAVHPTEFEEQTATREEMDHVAIQIGVSSAAREAHPLMLMVAQGGTHVELLHRTIEGREAAGATYFCAVPTSVVVFLGAFKVKIILHRDAAADPCMRQSLLDHQRQHSHVIDEKIDLFVDEHREELAGALHSLTRNPAPDAASAIQAFESGLASVIGKLYKTFGRELEQTRLEADTPSAHKQLRKACDGRLRRLELELLAPPGRRASR